MNKEYFTQKIIKNIMIIIIIITAAGLLILSINKKNQNNEQLGYVEKTGFFFDTFISFKLYFNDYDTYNEYTDDAEKYFNDKANEIIGKCNFFEKLFSKTLTGSDIYNINKYRTADVNYYTYDIIEKSINYSKITSGALDITIGTVLEGYSYEEQKIYDKSVTESLLNSISYNHIKLTHSDSFYRVSLSDNDTILDLGAVAKGYITDYFCSYLHEAGINNFIINLGGNMYVSGSKDNSKVHSYYNIGIQYPFEETGESIRILKTADSSVVTSGIYQRYFKKDNTIYHHIFSPFTGYPVKNDLYSVTIINPSSFVCDALSTAVFVLGKNKGMELINSLNDTECIMISNEYSVYLSKGLTSHDKIIEKK